ncbi:MAG: isoaspartyl peptidase/L-asparaginase [Candidatus Melainabacteria bacterium]|nr:isoaspartyl peptidase/L-asparaginase [Candidatus Melainabacteria bacterium]
MTYRPTGKKKAVWSGKNAVLLIHGGAGAINPDKLEGRKEKQCLDKLRQSLIAGQKVLSSGGSSLDAVVAAVKVLEDSTLFNAGKGSCLTRSGKVEMDAAIMDGATGASGAVTGLNCVRNPITAARAVMEHSNHVLFCGRGANSFARKTARKAGLKIVDPSYFVTQKSWRDLERILKAEKEAARTGISVDALTTGASQGDGASPWFCGSHKYGTVGAVGLDDRGNLAAATSTGGTTGKDPGRVGDSPIIGAGTFADNGSCAVSATGHGEYFMRCVAAHQISVLIKHCGGDVAAAAEKVIFDSVGRAGGSGGVIVLDSLGNFATPFNTRGMFRGVLGKNGEIEVAIF